MALSVVVVQPQARHDARPEALHQHVRVLDQGLDRIDALRRLEIEGDAPLVGVQEQEEAALLRVRNVTGKGAEGAGVVAGAGPLNLDDVGPVVGQELGAVRPRYPVGQVYDAQVR